MLPLNIIHIRVVFFQQTSSHACMCTHWWESQLWLTHKLSNMYIKLLHWRISKTPPWSCKSIRGPETSEFIHLITTHTNAYLKFSTVITAASSHDIRTGSYEFGSLYCPLSLSSELVSMMLQASWKKYRNSQLTQLINNYIFHSTICELKEQNIYRILFDVVWVCFKSCDFCTQIYERCVITHITHHTKRLNMLTKDN